MINREIRHAKSCFPLFVMAEPIYLNYGQNQIDLLAFLEAAANNVQNYVALQPWSNKRKELFMKAYSDIMSKGVTGASNANGVWSVQHNNGQIDLASKSKKEQEMYGEAAYFIQLLMSSITPKAVEDLKKEELPIFSNEQFNTGLQNYISTNLYGGMDFNQSRWNDRDSLDKYGIRSTTERAKILAQTLRGYANSIESDKYSFEGSPYKDIDTLKTNLNAAADALERGDWNNDTLYKIGIDPEQYLATGANDIVTIDNKLMRRGDAPEYYQQLEANKLKAELDAKAKEELAKKQQAMQTIKNNLFSKVRIRSGFNNMHGWSPNQIANQYTIATLNDKLNELSGRSDWTPEEQSLAAGAYKHSPKVPISQEEYNTLKAMTRFKDASKSRFSKILGVDGMIYDSATGSLIMAGATATNGLTDWLAGKSDKDKEKTYLESKIPGITNAEWKELASIGLDIGSIVDPEPLTAGTMGITAAGLRHSATNDTPGHKWGFWEGVGQGVDYLTGALAALPGLGDIGLGTKLALRSNKWVPLVEKAFRYAARAGAWKDLVDSAPGLQAAYDKITKGEELTIGDWRAIAQGIRGLAGHSSLNKANRATRKTLRKSGFQTESNLLKDTKVGEYLANRGWVGSKIKGETKAPALKVKNAEGKSEPIEITPEKKAKLEEAFAKTSKAEERTDIARDILGKDVIKEGYTVEVDNSWRTKLGSHFDTTRRTSDSFDTVPKQSERGNDNLETWLNNRGLLSKIYYGWNPRIRGIRRNWEIAPKTGKTSVTPSETNSESKKTTTPQTKINTPLTIESGRHHLNRHAQLETALENRILRIENKKFHHKPSIDKDIKLDVGSEHLEVSVTNGKGTKRYRLRSKGEKSIVYPTTSNVETLQRLMSEVIKRQHKKLDVDKIKELRKLFGLKHGGTIDKQRIQRYKQFIKK